MPTHVPESHEAELRFSGHRTNLRVLDAVQLVPHSTSGANINLRAFVRKSGAQLVRGGPTAPSREMTGRATEAELPDEREGMKRMLAITNRSPAPRRDRHPPCSARALGAFGTAAPRRRGAADAPGTARGPLCRRRGDGAVRARPLPRALRRPPAAHADHREGPAHEPADDEPRLRPGNAAYAIGTVLAVQFAQHLPQRRMLVVYAALLLTGSVLAASAQSPTCTSRATCSRDCARACC